MILLPSDMRRYDAAAFKSDAVAAMTVAIVVLPQSMAYALIAGVSPIYGLYAAIIAAIVGSFFGSSNHLITGPTNAISLMIAGAMKDHLGTPDFYAMLFLLTFLVGAIQVLLGVLKVGKVVNFVSHSVIVGFTAGAGIIIGLGQLNELFGIRLPAGYFPLYEKVWRTLGSLAQSNRYALGLALLTIVIVVLARRVNRRLPGALLALVLCAVLVKALGMAEKGVKLVGEVPSQLPSFQMVHLDLEWILHMYGAAFAVAIVGLVEAIAIAKSIALSSGQIIEPNREFIGQGLANIANSLFNGMPSSGSFTRSAVNYNAGAQTKMAGILSGILVAIVLVFFASYARYIPLAALAAVIVVVAYNMVDQHAIGRIVKASRYDMAVMGITIGATVLMPDLERAILTGIVISVLVHVWNTGEVKIKLLRQHGGAFREYALRGDSPRHGRSPVAIIHLDGDLYFGSADNLQEQLRLVREQTDATVYVIRLKRVNVVDVSAFEVVENFIENSLADGREVLLCGVSPPLKRLLDKTGLTQHIGEEHVFLAEDTVYASTSKAYAEALKLLESGYARHSERESQQKRLF